MTLEPRAGAGALTRADADRLGAALEVLDRPEHRQGLQGGASALRQVARRPAGDRRDRRRLRRRPDGPGEGAGDDQAGRGRGRGNRLRTPRRGAPAHDERRAAAGLRSRGDRHGKRIEQTPKTKGVRRTPVGVRRGRPPFRPPHEALAGRAQLPRPTPRRPPDSTAIAADGLTPDQRKAVLDLADNFTNQAQGHELRDFERLNLTQALAGVRNGAITLRGPQAMTALR